MASLVRFSGLASFPDGTVGAVYFTAATDYTKGAGNGPNQLILRGSWHKTLQGQSPNAHRVMRTSL